MAKIIRWYKSSSHTETKLMGMGEPMLHPQFDEVCRMFKETFRYRHRSYKLSIQEIKGSKFRKKFQEALKYIDMLYLSIDGWGGEHYERDRSIKWDVLMKFLEDFRTIERHGCEVPINYVVNAYNVDDIPKVEAFVDEYKLDGIRLNIAQIWDENTSMKDDIA